MSWGLFMSGILAGFLAVYAAIFKAKVDSCNDIVRETETVAEPAYVPSPCTMTAEEFNAGMDALMEIFAIKE